MRAAPETNSLRSALSAATSTPRRPIRGLILVEFIFFSHEVFSKVNLHAGS
jgi:hypothetical protein